MPNTSTQISKDGSMHLPEWEGRAIILLDLDAFFASVEQLDHPQWRGKPVIVGGDANKRGVVSTCSYEARAFGVHSAMPSSQAARLCPEAFWTLGNFSRYREVSNAVMDIILSETPYVQQVSIDEAFADITPTRTNREHPLSVATRIQDNVSKLGITCSIGLATSKTVAKIASDIDKPQGLTVVYPGAEQKFLAPLSVSKLSGVGAVAQEKLEAAGIKTLKDLSLAESKILENVFGSRAEMMRKRALGEEDSQVEIERIVKSVSHEQSFEVDLECRADIETACISLLANVGRRLRKKGLKGNVLTLKMRFDDRTIHTAQTHLDFPVDDDILLKPVLFSLIDKLWTPIHKVRLVGVGISGFQNESSKIQDKLFEIEEDNLATSAKCNHDKDVLVEDPEARRRLIETFDGLKDRFGENAVIYGGELKERS